MPGAGGAGDPSPDVLGSVPGSGRRLCLEGFRSILHAGRVHFAGKADGPCMEPCIPYGEGPQHR